MFEFITVASLMSISMDYKKTSYLDNVISNQSYYIEDIYNNNRVNYHDKFLLIDNTYKIKTHLTRLYNRKEVSLEVYNNASNLLTGLSEFTLKEINFENIYSTKYGTIVVDLEFMTSNIFSLEIGKNSIGYFSEINYSTFIVNEEMDTIDDNGNIININVLRNDIDSFLNKINIV